MGKELCFYIENTDVYLEQVLVDYNSAPIFFLCKGNDQYYIALCTDMDEWNYIVARVSSLDVYNLLHGNIPMRDVITKQSEYWDVSSGDDVYQDVVIKKNIAELETDFLPEENAFFKILTKEVQVFKEKFDNEFLTEETVFIKCEKVDFDNVLADCVVDGILEGITQLVGVINCKVKISNFSITLSYDEKMECIVSEQSITTKLEQCNQNKEDDFFYLSQSNKNNLAAAA